MSILRRLSVVTSPLPSVRHLKVKPMCLSDTTLKQGSCATLELARYIALSTTYYRSQCVALHLHQVTSLNKGEQHKHNRVVILMTIHGCCFVFFDSVEVSSPDSAREWFDCVPNVFQLLRSYLPGGLHVCVQPPGRKWYRYLSEIWKRGPVDARCFHSAVQR